jgi:hypothetical protein
MKNLIETNKELVNLFIVNNSKQSGKDAIEKLIFTDQKNDKTKFNNLIKMGVTLKKSVTWFENFGSTEFKEFTGIKLPKSEFFELFFTLKKAWSYRLIKAGEATPEQISNFLDSEPHPTIDKFIAFLKGDDDKKETNKKELTINFQGRKLNFDKGEIKNASLSVEDAKSIIKILQQFCQI